jgi:hypothetical protein
MKIMDNDRPLSYWQRIAEQNGISRRIFNHRVKRGAMPKQAATTPLKNSGGRKTDPNSYQQISLRAGLSPRAISRYMVKHPDTTLTPQQVADLLVAEKAKPTNAQKAKEAGLSPQTVSARLRRKWPPELVYSAPPMTPRQAAVRAAKQRGINRQQARQGASNQTAQQQPSQR